MEGGECRGGLSNIVGYDDENVSGVYHKGLVLQGGRVDDNLIPTIIEHEESGIEGDNVSMLYIMLICSIGCPIPLERGYSNRRMKTNSGD